MTTMVKIAVPINPVFDMEAPILHYGLGYF